jgi:hypothetical protein
MTFHPEHPIRLSDGSKCRLALVSFLSENYINNVLEPGNIYFWDSDIYLIPTPFTISRGYWTIEKLNEKINEYITALKLNVPANQFSIKRANDRIAITSPLKFYLDEKVASFLGFSSPGEKPITEQKSFYDANTFLVAPNAPNFRAVDAIEVHCNIVEHSYINHDEHRHKHVEAELLYTFFLNVAHGYKIYEVPTEKLYVPLRNGLQTINRIDITLRDQNNRLLQNENVECVIVLDLYKS